MRHRRVLVCGGRDYADRDTLYRVLDAAQHSRGLSVLIEGGASGADALAREWASDRGVQVLTFKADWARLGKRAGPERNAHMLEAEPELVIAFPGGKGTRDMRRRAREAGVMVLTVEPSGMVTHGR